MADPYPGPPDRLRATLDSLLDPHVYFEAVRNESGAIVDFVYVDANDAACAYNHSTREEMIGRTLLEVLPGHAGSGILATYAHVVDSGEPLILDGQAYYNELLATERRSDVRGIRVGDGLSLTWRDVTERYEEAARLEAALSRFQLLAENASDVVVLTDRTRRITWISPSVLRVLGYRPEDVAGASLTDFTHPDDHAKVDAWRARLADRGPITAEAGEPVRFRTATGVYRWFTASASELIDDSGQFVGVVGALNDVDELVRARTAADAQRRLLQSTVDSLLDPHAFMEPVIECGRVVDFVFVDVNPATARYLGLSRSEVVGSRLFRVLPDAQGMLAQFVEVLETGAPLVLDGLGYRNPAMHIEHRYDVRVVPVDRGMSVTVRDVTPRYRAEQALQESETRFRLLAENSTDIVVHLREGRVEWASPSIRHALGWTPDEVVGDFALTMIHPDDLDHVARSLAASDAGAVTRDRFRLRDRLGVFHWVDSNTGPFHSSTGEQDGVVVSLRIVDSEVSAQEELELRARLDPVTGLANRQELFRHFAGQLNATQRSGHRTGVVFVDLDDFKDINDSYGHAAGDAFLRVTARRIAAGVRHGDFVARIGGDELLVVLDGVHDESEAAAIADKLRLAVAQPVEYAQQAMRSTASLGVTLAETDERLDDVVARADAAMYSAKAAGRNRVVVRMPR